MSFRLVPNSVTLDDLEWRNSLNLCVILPYRQISGQITWKWLEIHWYFLRQKCMPKNRVFSISLTATLVGDHP